MKSVHLTKQFVEQHFNLGPQVVVEEKKEVL